MKSIRSGSQTVIVIAFIMYVILYIADDPSIVAGEGKTAPIIASFQDVDGTNKYYITVEKKLFGGLTSVNH